MLHHTVRMVCPSIILFAAVWTSPSYLMAQDCNSNGIMDGCDISCGAPAGPCDVIGCGGSNDCNSNGTPDECEGPPSITRSAVHRGWWRSDGLHDASINNTFTGRIIGSGLILNSYFIFDISGLINPSIAKLRLEVHGYFGPDSSETISIYDVSTPAAQLEASGTSIPTFNDLQTGNVYATFVVRPSDVGRVLEIPLNAQAILDIRNANGFFAVGLHVDTIGAGSGDEGVRFSNASEQRIHQLVLGGFIDCNFNGTLDECDITAGTSTDCDSNGKPDECDVDCNTNGIPDPCDVASGTSPDCNGNIIPDECETDCNENEIPDDCDINGGTSPDCNENGIPDECEIASGAVIDCNENGIPDECDVEGDASLDCNTDGIPDECQLEQNDCNTNGIPDECDIEGGFSDDCDFNYSPDECDPDCDGNGRPDACDVSDGNGTDCNANGALDACDIGDGTSADCDGNEIPDECDIATGGLPAPARIAFFLDGFYVDETSGAARMRSALIGRGHYVSAFSGATGASWTAALANADVVVLPEMDGPDLYNAMDSAARMALKNFVLNGGGLVQAYCRGTATNDLNLVNGLFGTSLTSCSTLGGPYNINPLAAADTIFAGGPASLPSSTDTNSLVVAQLPPGAHAIYTDGFETSLAFWRAGLGDVTWLGFSFDLSTTPAEWIEVVDRACSIRRSKDCNMNGVLDECEIAEDPSIDCDGNGVIDDCSDPDCNSNGIVDACDIAQGSSTDCNLNAVPDECDIARKGTSSPARIAFFFDATYVDEFGEAANMRDALASRGHVIRTFVGTTTSAWQSALTGVDVVVVPELDGPDLLAAMSMGARSALASFVSGGGKFIQSYSRSGSTIDLGLLNAVFGASLSTCDPFGGPVSLDPLAAVGTPFVDGPASLPASTDTNSLLVAQLLPGARAVYSNGVLTTLVTWRMGLGRVTWLGFDFTVAPVLEWLEVTDRAARITGSGDCNTNGIPDECEIAGGLSDDCDADGTPDECEIDCNSNGVNDECDIASGNRADCNANDIPDDCELSGNDCDGNGVPDECQPDCNANGVVDACDIMAGTSFDCQPDGIPDECQVIGTYLANSGPLSPFDASNPRTFVIASPPDSVTDVVIRIFVSGDFSGFDEYLEVRLNGVSFGVFFQVGGSDCSVTPLMTQFSLSRAIFNSLIVGGTLTTTLTPSAGVTPGTCGTSSVRIEVEYEAATLIDCNANNIPDNCDINAKPALDCDSNGVIDACEDNDCNSNGIVDPCDIRDGTSLDCNANHIPDECDVLQTGPVGYGNIALFYDPSYVDEVTEARLLKEALESRGHHVIPFIGTFGPLWVEALANADVVVIPELDGPDLYNALDTVARNSLRDFVLNGGSYVQAYARGTNDTGILNNLFGAGLTSVLTGPGTGIYTVAAAIDTPFVGGPTSLPNSNDVNALSISLLPASARAVYVSGTNATLATWIVGSGRVSWLGFDFFEYPTPPEWVEVLDRAVQIHVTQDCNSNGIPDGCEVSTGAALDCDTDGIPDECEPDCNVNGINDQCDISAGHELDCNGNGVPDSCDLAAGTSVDCNSDGIPDECQPDCNFNGITDACDIASGVAEDCNSDGIPDLCQIVTSQTETFTGATFVSRPPVTWTNFVRGPGWFFTSSSPLMTGNVLQSAPITDNESTAINASFDFGPSGGSITFSWAVQSQSSGDFLRFDLDGVNMLGQSGTTAGTNTYLIGPGVHTVQWRYEKNSSTSTGADAAAIDNVIFITSATTGDCNRNGFLDACDIAMDPMLDCDLNGVIDVCGDPDCNSNDIADECDISVGLSQDCNSNGVPDECDVTKGLAPVPGKVAFFFDSVYVDEVTEARLLRDALIARGHVVTTFNGTTGSAWNTALAGAECVVIPELDGPDLFSNMSASARAALSAFVAGGGDFVQAYCRDGSTIDLGILDGIFGASFTSANSFGGPTFLDTLASAGSPFEGGPASLPSSNETNSLPISQLPFGARAIYHNGTLATVATWGFGAGRVTWIGFDFTLSPSPVDWIEIADRAAKVRRSADCNSNGIPDSCDLANGVGSDCDSDGILDACEADCNTNGVNDQCDISGGVSLDCNENGKPDECELSGNDCNTNGIPDDCEPDCNTNGTPDDCELIGNDCNNNGILDNCEPDCNHNGIADPCDVQAGTSLDCQSDSIPDECQIVGTFSASSGNLTPFDSLNPRSFAFVSPPPAMGNVTLLFQALADLSDSSESVGISLNGLPIGTIFQTGGADCIQVEASLTVSQAAFNAAAGTGTVTIGMTPSSTVSAGFCTSPYIRVRIDYIAQGIGDCNDNGIPDDCDIATAPLLDCDSNGVIDFCGDPDCNSNGVTDPCDITAGTSSDCNSNGVPDECDMANEETIAAVHRGWWPDVGSHDSTNNNTFTGRSGTQTINSYFIFPVLDTRSINHMILRLQVEAYFSTDPFETVMVYDVTTDPVTLEASGQNPAIFEDLQSGDVFAVFNIAQADVGRVLEIPLNPAAIADVRKSSGAFSVGLHVSSASQLQVSEGVRFSIGNETRVHELRVFRNYDCDGNGVFDTCEIDDNDCNANGILDACDINFGTSQDCNSNGIPDSCDVAATDCNSNGIPDDCDISTGTSQDVDSDGAPDECELDVRLDIAVRKVQSGQDTSMGPPSSDSSVDPGSIFYLELWASDLGQANTGLVGVFADMAFTPGRFEVLSIDHRPPFTLLTGGAIDNTQGTITGLGGNDETFSCPGISPTWVRVAVLECQALPALCTQGQAEISLSPSLSEVSACGRGAIHAQFQELGTAVVNAGVDCVYDKTGDGFINAGDLGLFAGHWLTGTGDPNFDPACDFDCSGFIAAGDLGWFATGWLQSCGALSQSDLPPCRRCVEPIPTVTEIGFDPFTSMIGASGAITIQDRSGAGLSVPDQVMVAQRFVRQSAQQDSTTATVLPAGDANFQPGEQLYFELWVRDETPGSRGLTAIFMDVDFNPAQVLINDVQHASTFDLLPSGNLQPQRIARLGGATLEADVAVRRWTRVAMFRMTALVGLPVGPRVILTPSMDGASAVGRGTVTLTQSARPTPQVMQKVVRPQ